MARYYSIAAVLGICCAAALVSAEPGPTGKGEPGEAIKWDVTRLNQEPLKFLRATAEPQRGRVVFLVEFVRPPKASELYDWEKQGGPVLFRFLDPEGIVIRTVKPSGEGEFVPEKGAHMRIVLPMPEANVLAATRSVMAD